MRRDDEHLAVGKDRSDGVEPAQRPLVGPVQVLEQHQHGRLLAEVAEVLARAPRCPGRAAPAGSEGSSKLPSWTSKPSQAPTRAALRGPASGPTAETKPSQPRAHDVARVVDLDVQPRGEQVAQQHVHAVLARRRRPPAEPPHRLGPVGQPGVEVVEQPGLADAGVAHDRDHAPPGLVDDVPQPVLQEPQLQVASDGARLDALDARRRVEPEPEPPLVVTTTRRRPARRCP